MSFSNPKSLKMLGIAFLAQFLALGLTYGSYGAFVIPLSEQFNASRALSSSGLAVTAVVMGICSPWVGRLLARFPIQNVLTAGAVCMALGFSLLTIAPSIYAVLLIFVLIGIGMVLLGPIPVMTLVASWFYSGRGKALGLAMVPFGMFIVPPVASAIVEKFSWQAASLVISIVILGCIPLLRIARKPADIPSENKNSGSNIDNLKLNVSETVPIKTFLYDPVFLAIAISAAIVISSGAAISAHLIPYGRTMGFDATQAALLMSVYGAAATFSSVLFGWLADKIGGMPNLFLNAAMHVLSFALIVYGGPYAAMLTWAGLIGLCAGGTATALSAALGERYPTSKFSQSIGLALAMNLPFTFGTAPFIGFMYDVIGNYSAAFMVMTGLYIFSTILLLPFLSAREK